MTDPSSHNISERGYKVTPLELFFDLVFVFGVWQLSHHLLDDHSWRGAIETLVLLLAIFAVWLTTSWSATIHRADKAHSRRMILIVMLLGLFMNASLNNAFSDSGWAFVIPFLVILLGRAVWMLIYSTGAYFRTHYFRVLIWTGTTAPLWIVGAMMDAEARLVWWGSAAVIDTIGRWLAHPVPGRRLQSEHIPFDLEHLLERCRLFLIIALGEVVFETGTAIAEVPTSLITLVTGTLALVATVALWALNFSHSERLDTHYHMETSDPIMAGRYAINTLIVMVAGLVAVSVAYEMVITHPHGHTSIALGLLLCGGPILYLVAQSWYLRAMLRDSPHLRLIGSGVLVMLGFASMFTPPYIALTLVSASLATLALLDQRMIKYRAA